MNIKNYLKIKINNSLQESVKILYGDSDILYLSIHSLYKISKYNGKDGAIPKIYKLGSKAWKNLKIKTKKKVKKIAFDLIKLYAKRKEKRTHSEGTSLSGQVWTGLDRFGQDQIDTCSQNLHVSNPKPTL